jgi:hypothetical protein
LVVGTINLMKRQDVSFAGVNGKPAEASNSPRQAPSKPDSRWWAGALQRFFFARDKSTVFPAKAGTQSETV